MGEMQESVYLCYDSSMTMTQRDRQREETKRRIYDCAFRLFETKGFANVKVQEIAEAAGVSIGGLYHHYKSKEEIIDYGYVAFDENLQEQYEAENPKTPQEGIRCLIGYQMEACLEKGVSIISITFRNQIGAENRYRYWEGRYIYQKLKENLKDAGLSDALQKEAARIILRSSRGCVYDWCCKNGGFDLKAEALKQTEMILQYYGIG